MNFLPQHAPLPPTESLSDRYVAAASTPVRVLVVEDDPTQRELLSMMLDPYNVEIDQARDVRSAEVLSDSRRYDLAIVDMRLPFPGDGVGVLKTLRAANPGLPICVYSGDLSGSVVRSCVEAVGVVTFTPKDFIRHEYLVQLFDIFNLAIRAGMKPKPASVP